MAFKFLPAPFFTLKEITMNQKKHKISHRALWTELHTAMECISELNVGYAIKILQSVLDRIDEYDLAQKDNNVKK